jgi:hypothetical protein
MKKILDPQKQRNYQLQFMTQMITVNWDARNYT